MLAMDIDPWLWLGRGLLEGYIRMFHDTAELFSTRICAAGIPKLGQHLIDQAISTPKLRDHNSKTRLCLFLWKIMLAGVGPVSTGADSLW